MASLKEKPISAYFSPTKEKKPKSLATPVKEKSGAAATKSKKTNSESATKLAADKKSKVSAKKTTSDVTKKTTTPSKDGTKVKTSAAAKKAVAKKPTPENKKPTAGAATFSKQKKDGTTSNKKAASGKKSAPKKKPATPTTKKKTTSLATKNVRAEKSPKLAETKNKANKSATSPDVSAAKKRAATSSAGDSVQPASKKAKTSTVKSPKKATTNKPFEKKAASPDAALTKQIAATKTSISKSTTPSQKAASNESGKSAANKTRAAPTVANIPDTAVTKTPNETVAFYTSKECAASKRTAAEPSGIVSAEPASKRAKTTGTSKTNPSAPEVTTTSIPRVTNKLTLKELYEEAEARGHLNKKALPKLKADLLHYLVDGTIHLSATEVWKQIVEYRKQIESEKINLYAASLKARQEQERVKEQRLQAQYEKKLTEQRAQEKIQQAERQRELEILNARREEEKRNQVAFHKHSFPFVHTHPLAHTADLKSGGRPRDQNATCDSCEKVNSRSYLWLPQPITACCVWSCEQCGLDFCKVCFDKDNVSPEEKKKRLAKERKAEQERIRREEAEEKEEEQQREIRWDANKQFKKSILKPPASSKKHKAAGKGFTVWCSSGYSNDGWHSYEGEPEKEFDSSWKTESDASDRARYLFYWKNCWGLDPNEMAENNEGEMEESFNGGLVTYSAEPADSERWTVSVVPDAAFIHLGNATIQRHNHDDERVPTVTDGYGFGMHSNCCY